MHLAGELEIIYQLELKIYDQNDVIFTKLRTLIDELGCADLLQFPSFDFVQLKALKKAIPIVPTVGLSYSRSIEPAALARNANVNAINIEIQHFPSGESYQLDREGFAVFLLVPAPYRLEKLKSYGLNVEDCVVNWIREGQLDQIIGDDVSQTVRIRDRARGQTCTTLPGECFGQFGTKIRDHGNRAVRR